MNATDTSADDTPGSPNLGRLLDMLRAAQLPVGPSEAIDAAQVLRHLAASVPPCEQTRTRLRSRLRPVLCKSLADQGAFDEVFERWSTESAGQTAGASTDPVKPGTQAPFLPGSGDTDRKRRVWPWRWIIGALLLAIILFAGSKYIPLIKPPGPGQDTGASTTELAPQPPAPESESAPSSMRDPDAPRMYGYFPALRSNEEVRPVWLWVLLPFVGIGVAMLFALPLPRISRSRGAGRISLQDWPASRYQRDLVARIAPGVEGQLQRHLRGSVEHRRAYARRPLLDARRTVEATIRRLGMPTLRYRYARLRPAYLVLVKAGHDDEFGILWAQRLRDVDARVDIFRFGAPTGDAAPLCTEVGGAGRRFGFNALPRPEPGQRLIILAPLDTLLDERGHMHAWARSANLARWEQRVLFTPEEPRDWNPDHVYALERQSGAKRGMLVLPQDDNALAAWSELLVRDYLPDIVLSEPQRYPRVLREGEARFVGDADAAALGDSPQAIGKLVSRLVGELQVYLGENGFYWLCACAVPPLLDRRLALLLGEQYFLRCHASEERTRYYMARSWRRLVRLPWLRDDAPIPQWLRLALLARLPEAIQEELREVVRGVLVPQPGEASGSGFQLDFEGPAGESVPAGSRPGPTTGQRHSLYVGFVRDGLTAEQLVLRIPGAWDRWLPALLHRPNWRRRLSAGWARLTLRDGIAGQGIGSRGVLLGVLTAAVGAVGWLVLALFQPGDWPPSIRDLLYTEASRSVMVRHGAAVNTVAYSNDGSRFVTASHDHSAQIWNAANGQAIGAPMRHGDSVRSASFSADGRFVVTASSDRTAHVWDASTGLAVGEPMKHDAWVRSASFSPDGTRVVTASGDKTARIWDAATGTLLGKPMQHGGTVWSASFSRDGRRIVTASDDGTARVWDTGTSKPTGLMVHRGPVWSASFSPDGKHVVTASADKTARVWDTSTHKSLSKALAHGGAIHSARFSPDGSRVVTASDDRTARVWDADSGAPVGKPMTHAARVWYASFSSDGRRVLTASDDGTARTWHADTGESMGMPMSHDGALRSAGFSSDGGRVITASSDHTARVWDAAPGRPVGKPMTHQAVVRSPKFSPDGRHLVTASSDGTARIWDAATGDAVGAPMRHDYHIVISAEYSPDGRRIVTASSDKTARLWDAGDGKPLGAPMTHGGQVWSASFSPDGKRVVTASSDGMARIWNAAGGTPLSMQMRHDGMVTSASFSADGNYIVTVATDLLNNSAQVWDVSNGGLVGSPMSHGAMIASASFSPDGKRVVTASSDHTARIWDAKTGKPVGAPMTHREEVSFASFSPDGRLVVTASGDRTARLWDASTGRPLGTQMRHDGSVSYARFSPDGSRVATVGIDGAARVWSVAGGALIGVPLLSPAEVTDVDWRPDGQRLAISTGAAPKRSPYDYGQWSLAPNSRIAADAQPASAYVVMAPQTAPRYPGQGGVEHLRERIGRSVPAHIGATSALIVLAAALALTASRRQRRQLAVQQQPRASA